jgi:hypothetical protein
MKMREKNILECQMMRVEITQILINVALRINDGCDVAVFVSDQIGGV